MLGHRILEKEIKVDKAKIKVMTSLEPPKTMKEKRSFLGHVGFYMYFIKDFSLITRPLQGYCAKRLILCLTMNALKPF